MSVPLQNFPGLPNLPQSGQHSLAGSPTSSCSSAISLKKNSSLQADGMLPEGRECTDSSMGITENTTLVCRKLQTIQKMHV